MIKLNLSIRLVRNNFIQVYAVSITAVLSSIVLNKCQRHARSKVQRRQRPDSSQKPQICLGREQRGRFSGQPEVENVGGGDTEVPLKLGRWKELKEKFRAWCKV